ncbi:glutathione-dependent formaldehyde-activating, GFA [Paraglaciecola sp. T6c]|uniref:GFA family protein n=1 Tax=Pseudoalteromonas atlantica (strain T6c / ATCC BAA-1087) TaxID=3042615 RepID=UPI00005C544F|nr:GFA family protein [Paraglaciecola sp. T6c]ABG41766.1 glutathione-dependent formaldehyde-activating, GFA [Paraglaciecola sp. T6c]
MKQVLGSCLCNRVTYACENNFSQFHLCHCTQCQKATGSAYAANLFTDVDNIKWLTGEALIMRFNVAGRSISNAFCGECGSAVPYKSLSGKALVVPAGSLDCEPNIQPQSQIFYTERAPWFDSVTVCKKFDSMPK